MSEIDPYAELWERATAEEYREIKEIERAARSMAKRLGFVFVPDPVKARCMLRAS